MSQHSYEPNPVRGRRLFMSTTGGNQAHGCNNLHSPKTLQDSHILCISRILVATRKSPIKYLSIAGHTRLADLWCRQIVADFQRCQHGWSLQNLYLKPTVIAEIAGKSTSAGEPLITSHNLLDDGDAILPGFEEQPLSVWYIMVYSRRSICTMQVAITVAVPS